MKILRKYPLSISLMLVLVFSLSAGVKMDFYPNDGEQLKEVCRQGIVYLPPGTKYIKCNGKVKRINRITPLTDEGESCICPQCCGGECAVIVSCDVYFEQSDCGYDGHDQIGLCLIWIDCE